jgi:class 3 adenylate cyclase
VTSENVAFLFTDMVASTERNQLLSPEAADEDRRGHFSILRQAIAQSGGSEVKNLGDGLMVAFGSTSAALACAVAMQQGVEVGNRDQERVAGLRIGLSIGEVTQEEHDYFGDAVVEAARLCASCEGGQILATVVVRAMAGRRTTQEFRSIGPLSLKGLADPVEGIEVLWDPVINENVGAAIPLPGRLAVRPPVGVVGRDAELAVIADAVKRSSEGEGREVLLVSGEAGLGKTTLVAEAARAAFASGSCVLFGHCEEGLATPYQLFTEALGHYVTNAPESQLLAHVEQFGSELARLVPALRSRMPELPPSRITDADSERYLLFEAVVGLLGAATAELPVVVVLDDLQWADSGSLQLLRHLTAAEQAMSVLLLGTYRDSELSHAHNLLDTLAALHRQRGVSRIDLSGLDDTGVLAMLEATAGYKLDDAGVNLAHAVFRETDGNPFFVSEVLRSLAETGDVYQDASGRWAARADLEQMALPESVRIVIGARVSRLGPQASQVLSVASVIGRDFDLELLARVTASSEDDLLDILEAAAAVALVREPTSASGLYSFAHALIQHTLYEDMGPNRQARAHLRVAEALEDLCGDRPGSRVGELARHWASATQPINVEKAVRYARQAGDAALAALAPGDALRYYTQALQLYPLATEPDPLLAVDLGIGLGTAQSQVGDSTSRRTLLDAARRAADLGHIDRLVAAALANDRGWTSSMGVIDADKVAILELALNRLNSDTPERALVLATLCSELAYGSTFDRRLELADEAVAIAETSGDDAIVVWVQNHISDPLYVPWMFEARMRATADALERAERIGDPFMLFHAALNAMGEYGVKGDIDNVDRCLEIMRTVAARIDQPFNNWNLTLLLAERAMLSGNIEEAERLAESAFQIGIESGQPDASFIYEAQRIYLSVLRGTLGEAVTQVERLVAANPGFPAFRAFLASAHVEAGQTDAALRILNQFAEDGFELPLDLMWLTGMVQYAEVALDIPDARHLAGPLFDRLVPYADLCCFVEAWGSGPVSHYLGSLAAALGRQDQADAHFDKAAEASRRMGSEFYIARTDVARASMLCERGTLDDIERARELLGEARTTAASRGFGGLVRRTDELLEFLA